MSTICAAFAIKENIICSDDKINCSSTSKKFECL